LTVEFDTGWPPLITNPSKAGLGVDVRVGVAVALRVGVAETVGVAVRVMVGVAVTVAVAVGVGLGTGVSPIPSSFTFCGLLAPPSVKVSEPWNAPFDGGMNVTETVKPPPGDKVPGPT
jgi:hypothetical protein